MTTTIEPSRPAPGADAASTGPDRSTRLSRLVSGRRSKFLVLAFWLVLAALAGPLAMKVTEVQDNDQLLALPANAEARAAADRAADAFPQRDALVAVVVYARDTGLTPADRSKVDADRAAFVRYAEGGEIPPAAPSADGKALLLAFPLAGSTDEQADAVGDLKRRMNEDVPDGLRTAMTGTAGATDDVFDAFAGMDTTLLLVTALTVALLLILTYRSPVLWLLPLVVVAIASQVTNAVVYLMARYADLTVDMQSQNIVTILVFGVGVDYALLLLARYREALHVHADRHAAMAEAVRRSFHSVLASAATVAIGLLCLLAADLPSTRGLGPVAAIGVTVAFVTMMTLLPVVVVIFGRWVFWPFVPKVGEAARTHRLWAGVAGLVGRHPRVIWLGTAAALLALMFGIGKLSIGLPNDQTFTTEVGSVTGQHLIEAHYPGGTASPAEIVVTAASADRVASAARTVPGVADVSAPETSADGQWVRLRATLADPPDSRRAMSTLERLRGAVRDVPDSRALVGGDTATILDTRRTADRDNRVVMPLILAVVFLILTLLLRALVAPLLLLVSVVLSYGAALGVAGLVLDAMGHPRLWEGIPLQTYIFLVALGVDYTIFLMTRAREETVRHGHREGVLHALAVTGGVITSAGVVLAATFAALNVLPLVPSVQVSIIVSVGVLLDTVLVRSLLVPALSLHLGRLTWWPGRLARTGAASTAEPSPAPVAAG